MTGNTPPEANGAPHLAVAAPLPRNRHDGPNEGTAAAPEGDPVTPDRRAM